MKRLYKLLLALLMLASFSGKKVQAQNNSGYEYSAKCLTVSLWATDKRAWDSCAQVKYTSNGAVIATGSQASYTFTAPGNYIVCMKILNTCKKWDTQVCKHIVLTSCDSNACNLTPEFSVKVDCLKVKLLAGGNVSGASYSWSWGDGTSGTGKDPSKTFFKAGTYKVCLTMTWIDPNTKQTCKKTVCKEIKVGCGEPCNIQGEFKWSANAGLLKFNAYSNSGYFYEWNFGDGTKGSGKDPMHQYKKPGTYTVCVKIFDKTRKCSITICKKVVIEEPCNIKATFAFLADGNTVKFAAISFGGSQYVWSFGDGTSGSGSNPSHTYARPGTYKVCITVYSKNGRCKTTVCKTVVIKETVKKCNWASTGISLGYSINCPKLVLEGKNLNNKCISYGWSVTPAGTNKATVYYGRVQYLALANGTYNVCMKVYDSCNNCDTTICKSITVKCETKRCDWSKVPTNPTITVDCKTIMAGLNTSNYPCIKQVWYFGSNAGQNGNYPKWTVNANGTYKICLKLIDSCGGCDTTICREVKVDCGKKCNWAAQGAAWSYTLNCPKLTLEAKNLNNSCISYGWSVTLAGTNSGSTYYGRVQYLNLADGIYNVCMKMYDSCNKCDTVICKTITVKCNTCNWKGAGYTYKVDCNKVTFTVNNLSNACHTYLWSYNKSLIGTGKTASYTFTTNGTYSICVKYYDTCKKCDTTICQDIKISCQPCKAQASFKVDSTSKTGVAYVTNTSTGGYYYVWSWGDSSYSYTKSPGKHAYSASGSYKICLTVYDSLKKCSTTYCITIQLVKSRSASLNDIARPETRIYPNPTADVFTIATETGAGTYEVVTLQGKVISSGSIIGETVVNTQTWAEGLYLVRTNTATGQQTTRIAVSRN
jgi:PKD repeat protein